MEYLQQLLQQYHSGDATAAEREQLLMLLEKQGMSLQQALQEAFGEGLDTGDPLLTADRAGFILRKMHAQIEEVYLSATPAVRIKMAAWKKWTAVAAAILIIVAGWQWLHTPGITAVDTVVVAQTTTAAPLQLIRNATARKETIMLPDSSTVVLSPGSVLSYAKQFDSLHRSLYLQGEACFDVAKDAKRPFTVYANDIATTALGTRFSVSTFYGNEQVRVRLIEGKVVVRRQENKLAMQPVYLVPGQECTVNNAGGEAIVQTFKLKATTPKSVLTQHNKTPDSQNASLDFSREPLKNVFKRIEQLYHVSIEYPGVNLGGLSFTGTFLPTDSLPVVLSIICKTNDLAFNQKDSLITITSLP